MITIHNPTVRFWFAFLLVVQLIFFKHLLLLILLSGFMFFLAWKNGWRKGGGPAWWFVLLSFVFITLIHCVQWYPFLAWNFGGLWKGLSVAFKFFGFMTVSVWFMSKTTPIQLISLFENFFRRMPFLKHRHLGVSIGIATSTLPEIRNSFQMYRMAYQSSYQHGDTQTLAKFHYFLKILPAIFIRIIKRTDDLAVALYCRGFREHYPTNKYPWNAFEKIFFTLLLAITLGIIMMRYSL